MTLYNNPQPDLHRRMTPQQLGLARGMRKRPTLAETQLWELLRGSRLDGLRFRRQHAIGQFIVDFFCPRYRLVIEVDGAVHDDPQQQQRDRLRDQAMREDGLIVLRLSNDLILCQPNQAIDLIREAISGSPLHKRSALEGG